MRIAGIGYQGRTLDELIECLRSASITTLIDVRELPWSRRAEFAKKRLAERLAQEGIRYLHLKSAGNPRDIRKSEQWYDEASRLSISVPILVRGNKIEIGWKGDMGCPFQ